MVFGLSNIDLPFQQFSFDGWLSGYADHHLAKNQSCKWSPQATFLSRIQRELNRPCWKIDCWNRTNDDWLVLHPENLIKCKDSDEIQLMGWSGLKPRYFNAAVQFDIAAVYTAKQLRGRCDNSVSSCFYSTCGLMDSLIDWGLWLISRLLWVYFVLRKVLEWGM